MRPDLASIPDEVLAEQANMGLLKRARRELDLGLGPTLALEPDGTLAATFPCGTLTCFPITADLRASSCSCGASMCRHRLMTVLILRELAPPAPVAPGRSPGTIPETALEALILAPLLAKARREWRAGVVAEVLRGNPPTVRLPTATVRFLASDALGMAACDCSLRGGCPHLAQAVWAFREADAQSPEAVCVLVNCAKPEEIEAEALWTELESLWTDLLFTGVAGSGTGPAMRVASLVRRFDQRGWRWPAMLLEHLDEALCSYRDRTARYAPESMLSDLVSLAMRCRAIRSAGELPPSFVLGAYEPAETPLDLIRVVSLGGHVELRGEEAEVSLTLADAKTGSVFLLRKRIPKEGLKDLGSVHLAPGVRLANLATGQLLAYSVYRRANQELRLGRKRGAPPSLTPQNGDWSMFPSPLLVRTVTDLEAMWRTRPPWGLRPPCLTEDIHIWPVAQVIDLGYDAGQQTLRALAKHPDGTALTMVLPHQAHAPQAVDAVARALSNSPRYVAGQVRRRRNGFEVILSAVATDTLTVPIAVTATSHARMDLTPLCDETPPDPLQLLWTWLAELAHHGLGRSRREDRLRGERLLENLGLKQTAALGRELLKHLENSTSGNPNPEQAHLGATLFLDLAIRVSVGLETFPFETATPDCTIEEEEEDANE